MLNELANLSDTLERRGIKPPSWHPNYKQCPNVNGRKKITLWVYLAERESADGKEFFVKGVERFPVEQDVRQYRKWEISNGNSFPAFNLSPMVNITSERDKTGISSVSRDLTQGRGCEGLDMVLQEWINLHSAYPG